MIHVNSLLADFQTLSFSSPLKLKMVKMKENVHKLTLINIRLLVALFIFIIFFLFTTFHFYPYKKSLLHSNSNISTPTTKLNKHQNFITKRSFNKIGYASYLFIQMGAYRNGLNSFSIIGLASKAIDLLYKPNYTCKWIPHNGNNTTRVELATSYKMLPDWNFGRIYTVVVLNCTFATNVGMNSSGGKLVITAHNGVNGDEDFVALDELPRSLNVSVFTSSPKYDYLYCGSPLYGDLSPSRVREWIAYHAKLFGDRSHFIIHDSGGIHSGIIDVLKPWIKKGFVTLQDVKDQEKFDGYYHNQFLVLNDCLHRYKFDAKWIFFFDLDEFIYVDPEMKFDELMHSMLEFTQFTIRQVPMSSSLCLELDRSKSLRMWDIEKLVYKDVKRGKRLDRKYAIQPRNAFSAGVHLSQNFAGKSTIISEEKMKYYHYHGGLSNQRNLCRSFVNGSNVWYEGNPYVRDESVRKMVDSIKSFELKTIGNV